MAGVVLAVLLLAALASGQRVRRDYLKLSQEERDELHAAIQSMKDSGEYDEFVRIHMDASFTSSPGYGTFACGAAHSCSSFLPWHRAYLIEYESALQRASNNTNMAVPYWDWLTDGRFGDPHGSAMWTDTHMGGDGDVNSYNEVKTGPWANWPIIYDEPLGGPSNGTSNPNMILQRAIGRSGMASLPTDAGWEAALLETVYDKPPYANNPQQIFRTSIEGSGNAVGDMMHGGGHGFVGGSMSMATSPNDPIFFLHHAFVDLLWEEWQQQMLVLQPGTTWDDHYAPQGDGPEGQNIDDAMLGLGPYSYTPRQVLDLQRLGYVYEPRTKPARSALDALFEKKAALARKMSLVA